MATKDLNTVGFARPGKDGFHEIVISRVKAYFVQNNISPYANTTMWVKTTVMLLLYFVPYILMVTGVAANEPWFF